jgi:hypothetical protein
VDKKKVREAIGRLQVGINAKRENIKLNKKFYPKQDNIQLEEDITVYETAIEALKKQLPKKVKMRTEYRDLNDELICYKGFCPSCGNVVDSYRNKSCNHCTQMLDWSEAH